MEEFVALFNQAKYFDAHEQLEQVWLEAEPEHKPYLQGLIQIAALMHLVEQGRWAGVKKVYSRACKNLAGSPEIYQGINLAQLFRKITNIVENQDKIANTSVKISFDQR